MCKIIGKCEISNTEERPLTKERGWLGTKILKIIYREFWSNKVTPSNIVHHSESLLENLKRKLIKMHFLNKLVCRTVTVTEYT